MGKGRDGSWMTHKGLKVLKVVRIEDGKLWSQYMNTRRHIGLCESMVDSMPLQLQDQTLQANKIVEESMEQFTRNKNTDAGIIRAISRGLTAKSGFSTFSPNKTAKTLSRTFSFAGTRQIPLTEFIDTLKLDYGRNEVLLFHGAQGRGARDNNGDVRFHSEATSPVGAIKQQGFDDRLAPTSGMFGSGTYFANMVSKADCYAGKYNDNDTRAQMGSVGEHAFMFVSRVTLGTPYLTKQSLEQLRRPPCVHGHFDLCLSFNQEVKIGRPWLDKGVEFAVCDHPRFNSVIGDFEIEGSRKLYREFIVYGKQCYPEFCVTYERTEQRAKLYTE
jgi:hypothetical protein